MTERSEATRGHSTVLILSEEFDPTVDKVVEELDRRGVPVFRVDTAWFPESLALDARLDGRSWSGVLRTDERAVELGDLRSIWYRRPTAFSFSAGMSRAEQEHAGWEAKFGVGGVLASLPALWVNHPSREADAAYKPWQLAVAVQCGLRVPASLVTNCQRAVQTFAERCGGDLIVKALGASAIFEQGGVKVAYTHRLEASDLADLSGVESTAHLFQEWVPKAWEARVTVVGEQIFAVAIEAHSDAARVDWRADFDALSYEVVDVPRGVVRGIARFMKRFDLRYGAFDFGVTPDRDWAFFECNAGGQYGWIEAKTAVPITAAVADLLEKGTEVACRT